MGWSSAAAQTAECQWLMSSGGAADFEELAKGPALELLRFGDFDGDGRTDVFTTVSIADGADRWMFSSGGVAAWNTLRAGPPLKELVFGTGRNAEPGDTGLRGVLPQDFDGDGKTDIFRALEISDDRFQWMFSSAGTGQFENLAAGPAPHSLMFGDFDGDGKSDVLTWVPGDSPVQYIFWSGGVDGPRPLAKGRVPVALGDFDGDRKTDVFVIGEFLGEGLGSQWLFSPGGAGEFLKLARGNSTRPAVGDFDGDGKSDVFFTSPLSEGVHQWMFSPGAALNFVNIAVGPPPGREFTNLAFGDFNGDRKTDVFAVDCE
jgi:hypothetical protein